MCIDALKWIDDGNKKLGNQVLRYQSNLHAFVQLLMFFNRKLIVRGKKLNK